MPTLLFYYPEKEKRWKLEVQSDRFTIGRSREVEVCIPHTSVSKRHLVVERRGPKYIFRDLGSKNGSYLNDFRMERGSLSDGDELRVGSIRITFYEAAAPPVSGAAGASSAKLDETVPPSSGAQPPSRADQETAALPRAELSDRLKGSDMETSSEPTSAEIDVLHETAADPDDGSGGESGEMDAPAPEEEPSILTERPRTIPRALLWSGGLGCIALGFVLGYLAASLAGGADGATPSSNATPSLTAIPPGTTGPGHPAGGAAVTTPADLADPATQRRLIVRLHIDLVGRPPTREEIRPLEKLSREELWYEITKRAGVTPRAVKIPQKPEEAFLRLLGRPPSSEETAALLETARGDLDHFAAAAGTSALYASAEHRRKRGEAVLARSLFTDLVGYPPRSAEEETVLAALRSSSGGVGPVARTLADSPGSLAGPRTDEAPEAWVDDVYSRLLLRQPTAEERKVGAAAARGGWRGWLAGIAADREYEMY